MKKFITILIAICLMFCLVGCTVEGSKNYADRTNGRLIPVPTHQDLYYDTNTNIVYIVFNEYSGNCGYGYMSPYYADNGMPYIYNKTTQTLEEINIINNLINKW